MDILESIEHAKTAGWISVKDQMPEQFESVLVCNEKFDEYRYDPFIAKHEVNGWSSKDSRADTYEITHWMPLPNLPKVK